jgi:hypothetical protein
MPEDEKLLAAVEVLLAQLQEQQQEVIETKKTINALRRRMGLEPVFTDLSTEKFSAGGPVRPDQFYGKPLATSVQEYLERRHQACPADEILKALEAGGFDFRALDWKESDRLRSFTITLSKNTKTFHRLPNGTFGLLTWYDKAMLRRAEKADEKAEEAAKE